MHPEFTLRDAIHAQGLALAMVGALLERDGVVAAGEFGRHLALLATVTGETDVAQGAILGAWAAMATGVDLQPKTES